MYFEENLCRPDLTGHIVIDRMRYFENKENCNDNCYFYQKREALLKR